MVYWGASLSPFFLLNAGKSVLGSALVVTLGQYFVINLITHAKAITHLATEWTRESTTRDLLLSLLKDDGLSNDANQGQGHQEEDLEIDLDVHGVKAGWRRQIRSDMSTGLLIMYFTFPLHSLKLIKLVVNAND
jgi:hypothetical protein